MYFLCIARNGRFNAICQGEKSEMLQLRADLLGYEPSAICHVLPSSHFFNGLASQRERPLGIAQNYQGLPTRSKAC